MKKKQSACFELAVPVYTRGTGLIIQKGSLLRLTKSSNPVCRLTLKSLKDCSLKSVTVSVTLYDRENNQLGEELLYTYENLELKRDNTFGESQDITSPHPSAASFTAIIHSVTTSDNQAINYSVEDSVPLTEWLKLEDALSDQDLIDQFRVRYGSDCRYVRSKQEDLWFCVCGSINFRNEQSCHTCHRARKAFTDLNMESLRAEAESRLKAESSQSSEETRKKRRFPFKAIALLLPFILLLSLLAGTVPGALRRERIYQNAVSALNAGRLSQAEELLNEIPSYRNSDELLNKEIPYQQALNLLNDAEIERSSVPIVNSSFLFSEEADLPRSILLFQNAAEAFEALSAYRDSNDKVSYCKKSIEEIIIEQKQAVYDEACSLLESLHYMEAKSIFTSLSGYADSETMMKECAYRKAVSLFRFLQIYDVSRIYAYFSEDNSEPSILSLSSEEALRLGSGCITELRSACGEDSTDIRLEDSPTDRLVSFKDALLDLFTALGNYKDAADYPAKIEEETDYTREFFMLCSTGDLHAASRWLNNYDGVFPDREIWENYLDIYLPYCADWKLYLGDSTLIPFSVGQSFSCMDASSRVLLEDNAAVLRISFGDGNSLTYDLPSELGETLFINTESEQYGFMAAITNNERFAYMCYSDGKLLSSCEYELAD